MEWDLDILNQVLCEVLGWRMRDVLLGGWIVNGLNFKFIIWAYTGLYKGGYIG